MHPNISIHNLLKKICDLNLVSISRENFEGLTYDDNDHWAYGYKHPDSVCVTLEITVFKTWSSIWFRKEHAGMKSYSSFQFSHYLRHTGKMKEYEFAKKMPDSQQPFEQYIGELVSLLKVYLQGDLSEVIVDKKWLDVPFDWSDIPGK